MPITGMGPGIVSWVTNRIDPDRAGILPPIRQTGHGLPWQVMVSAGLIGTASTANGHTRSRRSAQVNVTLVLRQIVGDGEPGRLGTHEDVG